MPIMYEPQNGMPVLVPDDRVNDFLLIGYRTRSVTPVAIELANSETASLKEQATGLLQINSASLKELTEQLGLSTTQAKELRDGRPYKTVEDLIAKIPSINWVSLSEQINYET